MAVGGSRQVAYMAGGRPAAKTQMTVTLSGACAGCLAVLCLFCEQRWHGPLLGPASCHLQGTVDACPRASHTSQLLMWGSCRPHVGVLVIPVPLPSAADNRVYDGEVASQFLAAFARHMANPYTLFQ